MADETRIVHVIRAQSEVDETIAALAERQHGLVTQLNRLGLERGAIGHRLRAGRLRPVHRGTHAVGHRPATTESRLPSCELRHEPPDLGTASKRALSRSSGRPRCDIDHALRHLIDVEGSDLHLKVGSRPMVRAHGRLHPIPDTEQLTPEDTERVFAQILTDEACTRTRSVVNQREVGEDTTSFARALRRVLRQDPDVILVGEMRDEETVRTALSAAETGHLVLSTIHTVDAPETVNRIIDFFPPHMHNQARAMLAGTLKGVVSQRLVPTPEGDGRVAVCEVLRMTGRVRDMIVNPDETGRLPTAISEGAYYGMRTFDQALLEHVQAGRVSMEDALRAATHPHDFKLLVASEGRRSTSVEQVLA